MEFFGTLVRHFATCLRRASIQMGVHLFAWTSRGDDTGPRSGLLILFCEYDTISGSATGGLSSAPVNGDQSIFAPFTSRLHQSFFHLHLYDYQSSVVILPQSQPLHGTSRHLRRGTTFINYRKGMDVVQQIAPNLTRSSPELSLQRCA